MPDEVASELLAFCVACPPPREVIAALAEIHFQLTFTMEEQRSPASLKTPPVPAQYHFRDAHVMYNQKSTPFDLFGETASRAGSAV